MYACSVPLAGSIIQACFRVCFEAFGGFADILNFHRREIDPSVGIIKIFMGFALRVLVMMFGKECVNLGTVVAADKCFHSFAVLS